MSFLKRFFDHESTEPIEVSSPAGVGEAVFAKRMAFTALAIAAGAVALSQAPAVGSLAYDKLELHRIGQAMVGTSPGEVSPEDRQLAQESIRFYRRFLAEGEGPGELRIEVNDIPKSAPSIFLAGGMVQAPDQWPVNMPDRCVLQLRSSDMEGLAKLATARFGTVDPSHTADGQGHEVFVAGEALAARTQCLLEAQNPNPSAHVQDVVMGAAYGHATILLAQQLGANAAVGFARTMSDVYGRTAVISKSAESAVAWTLAQPDRAVSANPSLALGVAIKVAKAAANDHSPDEPEDKQAVVQLVSDVARAVGNGGSFSNREAVFEINGKSIAWTVNGVTQAPRLGALGAQVVMPRMAYKAP